MSNWIDSVSLRARETFTQAEEGAHNAISKAKEAVNSVARRAEPPPLPEPSKAMDEQFGADITAMVNAQLSTIPPNSPSTLPIYNPVDLHKKSKELLNKSGELLRKIPEAIPGVKEFDSLAQDHHAQVMGEIGLVTSVVSGALGPPGAVAQLGIDFVVDSVGTKEDKYAYGAGQMVGAVVTGAAGLVGVGAGIAAEGGSSGAASEVAVPLAAAGAQTVVTAGSLALGAGILMSRGAAPVAKPASPDGKPRIDLDHILNGGINEKGEAVGFHWRGKGCENENAKVKQIFDGPNAQGVYEAKVEIKNPKTGQWVEKGPTSTFFPDHWDKAQVESAIQEAYANSKPTVGNRWLGTSSSGIEIEGTVSSSGEIITAYPKM